MGTFAETEIIDYRLSFANHGKQISVSVCCKQTEVCRSVLRLQQTNGSCCFPLVPIFVYIYMMKQQHIHIYTHAFLNRKRKKEAQTIFLNPFTVCSPCKGKFVICPFVVKETNRSNPCANGLYRLNGFAHL
jgi:hypothetical protein